MSAITKPFTHAEFSFRREEEKKAAVRRVANSPTTVREPERRLWKLSSSVSSTKFVAIEFFALVLFLILACVGIVTGFAELSHLLQSDAIGHIATQAINGGS